MAILVKDLVLEEVHCDGPNIERYVYEAAHNMWPWSDEGPSPHDLVGREIVPVHRFCEYGKPDLFLAYTEHVEKLLGVPIATLAREKEEAREDAIAAHKRNMSLQNRITNWHCASRWQRLKWAWHGAFPDASNPIKRC